MKNLNKALVVFTCIVLFFQCHKKKENPVPYDYTNVPDGGTATIDGKDLSNKGLI